jgi:uncharacterized protein YqiB (DUF1249 family)
MCEANYARLLRLFPDYESANLTRFAIGASQVHIDVLERSRYTTLFRLQSYRAGGEALSDDKSQHLWEGIWLAPLSIEARAYHDAGMLEVVGFQRAGKMEGRYAYPNAAMHQQDEKSQQNTFLADWLSHCLHHGEADMSWRLKPGTEHA